MGVGEPNAKVIHVREPGRASANTFPNVSIIYIKIMGLKDRVVECQAGTDPALPLHPRRSDLPGALLDEFGCLTTRENNNEICLQHFYSGRFGPPASASDRP